jgi:hypothetical protein
MPPTTRANQDSRGGVAPDDEEERCDIEQALPGANDAAVPKTPRHAKSYNEK